MHMSDHWRAFSTGIASAAVLGLAVLAAGCRAGSDAPPAGDAAGDHAGHAMARVYFVQPRDGARVTSPVQFEFASEHLTIMPVPAGEVAEQDVRPGIGHFHLGVNTDCLPDGQVIPQADPWIHFGSGATTIEMELTPGTHRFAVQAGDDLHRTFGGCETISVTVAE